VAGMCRRQREDERNKGTNQPYHALA